jgi:pimeloyl-ACP methyl ester carboxylesterase
MLLFASSPQAQQTLPRFEASDCLIAIPLDVRVDCGNLVVAEQRARPTGPTVRLPVAIFRAPQPSGASPLLMLHGGPGANGLRSQFSRQAAAWAQAFRRDIVVYDQRGAGLSQPRLCPEVIEKAIAARTTDIVGACLASLKAAGIEPSAYTTEANADDAIDLRRTLGHTSWDVYGVSYGGRLALELMRRDPSGLRAVILASALPVGPRFQAEDALTYQRALERIFANCAAQPNCATAFPTLERDFYTVHEELTARPIVVPVDSGSTLTLDASAFVSGIQRQHPRSEVADRAPSAHEGGHHANRSQNDRRRGAGSRR